MRPPSRTAPPTSFEDQPTRRLAIVVPIFNDWPSFAILLREIETRCLEWPFEITVVAVDDGSIAGAEIISLSSHSPISSVVLITLHCNLGHQRAIAVGVADCVSANKFTHILVMDSDGEDAPADIARLLDTSDAFPASIVVASRAKRSEGFMFRGLYQVYKTVFRFLTGRVITFGNFCLLPAPAAARLVHMADSWNHLAAAVLKSRIAIQPVDTQRASRYSGSSSMNLVSLVTHGFSAMSVFSDTILTRLLLVFGFVSFTSIAAAATAVILRLFTHLAIPGWATNVIGLSSVLFFQSLTLVAIVIFTNLSQRSATPLIPALQCTAFIHQRVEVKPKPAYEAAGIH